MTGVLVLLSGETWRTAVKLQGRSSGGDGKGEAEGKKERMDMMMPESWADVWLQSLFPGILSG